MNSDQNNNRGKGGGSKRSTTAIISIILWALVLTLLVNYATSRARSANSVEISYGQFRQLIMEDKVEGVVMESTRYTIILKEGATLDGEAPDQEEQEPSDEGDDRGVGVLVREGG